MPPKKKRSFSESVERWFRLVVIFMAKDMTLKNTWVLFLGSTIAGIISWTIIPTGFKYAYYKMPVISTMFHGAFPPSVCRGAYLVVCIYLTYVLLKPLCRGLVVCHPNYFNEGNIR